MGKFRKAAPGGRKGGTGKKAGAAKGGSRKPSKGVGRGKGQSKSFIPERANQVVGRGTKRKKADSGPKRRESEDRPTRSRESGKGEREERSPERKSGSGMYQRREAGGRPDSRAFDDKSPRRRDGDTPQRSSRPAGKPFFKREDAEGAGSRSSDKEGRGSREGDRSERSTRPAGKTFFKRKDSEGASSRSSDKEGRGSRDGDRRSSGSRESGGSSRPFDRKTGPAKPRKGRSEGKFFSPGEDDTTEKRKRIGQDDKFKRSEPGKFERAPSDDGEKKWNRKESHELYGDKNKRRTGAPSKQSEVSTAFDKEDGTRLNKFIANAGICSRREADEMIKVGVITVNGEIITEMGYKIQHGDVVKYNNETLRGERLVYILLNKPKDFITTTDDPEERKTVMNLIAKACKERVYPVGRLDRNTTGVLLFTNDGDIARKLTHPSFEVHKIYQVELDKALTKEHMEAVSSGITLDDGFIKVDEVAYATDARDIVGVEIHSGRNRIVRRIFEHLEYKVKKLDRVVFAGLTKKDLPRGRWRFLTELEVANLKMITGKKKVR